MIGSEGKKTNEVDMLPFGKVASSRPRSEIPDLDGTVEATGCDEAPAR
jgi:predicted nucleotidyltransferase